MAADEHVDDAEGTEADDLGAQASTAEDVTDEEAEVEGFMVPTIKPAGSGILDGLLLPAVQPATQVQQQGLQQSPFERKGVQTQSNEPLLTDAG
jgi:hypothetical protein